MVIAVSACLLGVKCRFDGTSRTSATVQEFLEAGGHSAVKICPEVMGGLSIPHPPSEILIRGARRLVFDAQGADNTEAFTAGAEKALEVALRAGCTHAILKAKSPSCGAGLVYDGTFCDVLVPGNGIAAQMFIDAGLVVATECDFIKKFGLIS